MLALVSCRLIRHKRIFTLPSSYKFYSQTYCTAACTNFIENASTGVSNTSIKFSNGREMTITSGRYARLADGSAVARCGDTSVMVTTVSKSQTSNNSFLPLVVDYRVKAAAAGRIPTNFLRRELGATETEILTSRLIDRSLRPLFPSGYCYETQVMCNMLALDGVNDPDVIAINAASAALALSDIPWNGPVGAVRVGLFDTEVVINPTRRERQLSSLNLIVTATHANLVVMMEGSADNVEDGLVRKAIKAGVKECQHIVKAIDEMQKKHGKPKREMQLPDPISSEILETVKCLAEVKLQEILTNSELDKIQRDNALSTLRREIVEKTKSDCPDSDPTVLHEAFSQVFKQIFRSLIFNDRRCDGRGLTDLRNISCQTNMFEPLHGSALFQRGQTQVLCTVTLDSLESAMRMDPLSMLVSGIKEKNFFLHYEFPPYATNETGRTGFAGRRELGHGALAEKGIRAVLPKDYPFTIRLTSEVLESNGSSSMASVCGGSLALMDAGVPITAPVAGVAIGLITKYDDNSAVSDYRILTDILGIEDYYGDMDFKVAGTRVGITSFQADIKIPGLPLKIVMEAIDHASRARGKILDIMNEEIDKPRPDTKANMPVTEKMQIPVHQRGKFLGVGGSNVKKIFVETGVQINSEDQTNFILFAPNRLAMDEAKEMIQNLLLQEREPDLEFRGIYTAKVVEIRDNGVMIQLYPTMKPTLLHNSQLDVRKISHPSALGLEVGQEIQVQYFGRDQTSGDIRLSRKVLQTPNIVRSMIKNLFG